MSDAPTRRRTSLQRRVTVALGVAGALLVVTVGGAVATLVEVRDDQELVLGTYFLAVTETDRSYLQVLNAETAVRGFILTGDERTLEPLNRLVEEARTDPRPDLGPVLEREFGAGSAIVRTREEASEAASRWYDDWAVPAIEAVRAGGPDAISAAEVERGRVLFDRVREPVEEHAGLLRAGRADAVEELEAATFRLVAAVGALAVMLVVGGTLLAVFLRRWVTRPLEHLAADVREVASGDLGHEVGTAGTGEVAEVSAVVEDMRRRLVRSIRDADAAKAALEESHERLREQADDLARSNRDLEQFAYVASHDLQEPLRKVASFTQLLAKRYEGQLDERADQYIAFAVDGAKRMQRLINDLLGFSRVGRIGGEVSDVDLQALVEGVVTDLSTVIEDAGGRVVAEDLPTVRGEAPLLRQLVVNLVGNAVKFRHPERAPVVHLSARQVEGCWEFACADNGIGIDPRYADRVFVIFQRLHAKDVYEGTGIGLALCKKIVEYHGGDIWIDQEATEGTTVRWTLPVTAEVPEPETTQVDDAPEGEDRTSDDLEVTA